MTNKSKNTTIDRLKTMSKNSRGNFVRNNLRILKYGIIGYGRNIWLSITSSFRHRHCQHDSFCHRRPYA